MKKTLYGLVIFANPGLIVLGSILMAVTSSAQSNDEKAVREVLTLNTTAFAKNDLAALDKIWANEEAVTVFENGHANYGWADYRNNHLAPEMKEFQNTKYSPSDMKVKIDNRTAWATFKYAISGEVNGKPVAGA